MKYSPEGMIFDTRENRAALSELHRLERASEEGAILEAKAVRCDSECSIYVEIGPYTVKIPRSEAIIDPDEQKDIAILSKVGRPVCFLVDEIDTSGLIPEIKLSRRRAQEEAMRWFMTMLSPGDVIWVRATRIERFGVFCDIGCGIPSFIGADSISVSRMNNPSERITQGTLIPALVTGVDRISRRVMLSHRELLGTWAENAAFFNEGDTVEGIVRGSESFGVFIELAPNLTGLAEAQDGLHSGQRVCVYIKSINEEKHKIKLSIIDTLPDVSQKKPLRYFVTGGRIHNWDYDAPSGTIYNTF